MVKVIQFPEEKDGHIAKQREAEINSQVNTEKWCELYNLDESVITFIQHESFSNEELKFLEQILIRFNSYTNQTDRQIIQSFIKQRYGISLPNDSEHTPNNVINLSNSNNPEA